MTHTGKGSDGINGPNSAAHHGLMGQTGPERAQKLPIHVAHVSQKKVSSLNLTSKYNRPFHCEKDGCFISITGTVLLVSML